jgi:hypothetical protein
MAKPSRTYNEVVSANRDNAKNFGDKGNWHSRLPAASPSSPAWTPGSIPQNTPAWPKATHKSSAMRAAEHRTMPFARWSFPISWLAPWNGSLCTTGLLAAVYREIIGAITQPSSAGSGAVSAPGVGVGHSVNGVPIGMPGSGLGSPGHSEGSTK